jgi:hypothetical protein
MKHLKHELLAAIAMLLIGLIAVTSSTFAWFSMNTVVTVDGLNLTAASADPFLQIKTGDEPYSTSTTYTAPSNPLKLVAPDTPLTNPLTWYEAQSDNPNQAVTEISSVHTAVVDGASTHMMKQALMIKNAANQDAENLEVSVVITGADATKIDHSFRVLLVLGTTYALFDYTGTLITDSPYTASTASLKPVLAAQEEVEVLVYMYFDGTDDLAKNVTAINETGVSAVLTFTVKGDPNNSATT